MHPGKCAFSAPPHQFKRAPTFVMVPAYAPMRQWPRLASAGRSGRARDAPPAADSARPAPAPTAPHGWVRGYRWRPRPWQPPSPGPPVTGRAASLTHQWGGGVRGVGVCGGDLSALWGGGGRSALTGRCPVPRLPRPSAAVEGWHCPSRGGGGPPSHRRHPPFVPAACGGIHPLFDSHTLQAERPSSLFPLAIPTPSPPSLPPACLVWGCLACCPSCGPSPSG